MIYSQKYPVDLIYQYTDLSGLPVGPEHIKDLLNTVGKSEEEIANFLGRKQMETNGCAIEFLGLMAHHNIYFGAEK